MQSTGKTIEKIHRGVIALNNAAVSLMEKSCHSQSAALLNDALAALKILQAAGTTLEVYNMSPLLANAAKSMANQAHSRGTGTTLVAVQVLSDRITETNLETACKMCQEIATQTKTKEGTTRITAIRIELDDFAYPSARCQILTSAILMYNYGLSLTCISEVSVGGVECNAALRTSAVNMVALSSSLLSSKLVSEKDNNYFSHTTIFYLQAVILVHLYPTLMKAGMLAEAASCFSLIQSHWIALKVINGSDIPGLMEKLAPAA